MAPFWVQPTTGRGANALNAMCLVAWVEPALPSVVRIRTALSSPDMEYLVVAQAETERLKIRCVLSVFVFVSIKKSN